MLSLDDLKGMCDCTEEEIEAIAIHEHLPDAVASELAAYLIHSPDGVPRICRMIIEDIVEAHSKGDDQAAEKLDGVLYHFIQSHPQYSAQAGA